MILATLDQTQRRPPDWRRRGVSVHGMNSGRTVTFYGLQGGIYDSGNARSDTTPTP